MINQQWYLQPAFLPVHPQDLVLWVNSSSSGLTWRNLAPSYTNVNHGTLINGVASGDLIHPSGVFGAPRKFDGANHYVNCGNDPSLNITDATMEAWVKPVNLSADKIIAGNADYQDYGYDFYMSAGKLTFRTNQNLANQNTISTETISTSVWSHIAVTRSGTTARIYINGTEVNYDAQPAHTDPVSSPLNFLIGTYAHLHGSYFNGSIDGVKIYNRALSASDVVHNHTHSPIYYMQHGVDPMSLLNQSAAEIARVVA